MSTLTIKPLQNPDTQVCPLCAGLRVIKGKSLRKGKVCPQCEGHGELEIGDETIYPVKAISVKLIKV